jgi:hypothetical protein
MQPVQLSLLPDLAPAPPPAAAAQLPPPQLQAALAHLAALIARAAREGGDRDE